MPDFGGSVLVEDTVERTAAVIKQRSGLDAVIASADDLMGPGARAGAVSRILEADVATVDDALAAFRTIPSMITKSLGTTLFPCGFADL